MKVWEVLQDIDGACSAKRVGFSICALIIFGSWIGNLFGMTIDVNVLTAATTLGSVSGCGMAVERFGYKE